MTEQRVTQTHDTPALHAGILFFENHWTSWIEQYAQSSKETDRGLRLPKCYAATCGNRSGIAIEVGGDPQAQQKARLLFGAIPLSPQDAIGNELSPTDLLARLRWHTSGLQANESRPAGETRLMIRLQAQVEDEFRRDVEDLIKALYRINAPGVKDTYLSMALISQSEEAYPYDGLFFISHIVTSSIHFWVNARLKRRGIKLYRPYEPVVFQDQQEHPRGIWLLTSQNQKEQLNLPYIQALGETIRNTAGAEVCLVEPDSANASKILRVDGRFTPFYFWGQYELLGTAGGVEVLQGLPDRQLKPFQIRIDLRENAEINPYRVMDVRSLDFAERQLQSRIEELTSEARYLRFRKRLARLEAVSGSSSGTESITTEGMRSLYLFFERHSGDPSLVHGWPALQEVVLNASICELERLKYTYCRMRLPTPGNENTLDIAFHLIGLPLDGRPSRIPAGLEHADLIFDLDPDWAELGYYLYVQQGFTLYPPIKPALPGVSVQPRVPRSIQSELSLLEDNDPWPGPSGLYRLFNDLLVQAVMSRKGNVTSSSDVLRADEKRHLQPDDICVIYQDPYARARVPLFFNPAHWQPLASVAPAQLNQVGLCDRLDDLLRKADLQVLERLQDYAEEETLNQQALEIIQDQHEEMLRLLDTSLQSRFDELEKKRLEQEEKLHQKTDAQAREFLELQQQWREINRELKEAENSLRRKLKSAEHLIVQIKRQAELVESLAVSGAQNWEDFVNQIVIATADIEDELAADLEAPYHRVNKADEELEKRSLDLIEVLRPRLDDVKAKLLQLSERVEGKTSRLNGVLRYIDLASSEIQGQAVPLPKIDAATETIEITRLTTELAAARANIQELQEKLQANSLEVAKLIQEHEAKTSELSRRAELAKILEDQLKNIEREQRQREVDLEKELQACNRLVSNLRLDNKTLKRQVDQARADLVQAKEDFRNRIEAIERKEAELREQLEKSDAQLQMFVLGSQSLENSTIRERFLELVGIIDNLTQAGRMADPANAQGIALIKKKFHTVLERQFPGLKIILVEENKTQFDPFLHTALGKDQIADLPDGVITRLELDGYIWNDKLVLREAQVFVNSLPEDGRDES